MPPEPPDLDEFPDGTPLAEIAAALGLSVREVRGRLGEPGGEAGQRPGQPIEPEAVAALLASGLRLEWIADCYGCNVATLSRRMVAAGMPVRPRADREAKPRFRATPELLAEMVQRYEAGEPLWLIGEAVGCSASTVWRTIRRLGHERRPFSHRPRREEVGAQAP